MASNTTHTTPAAINAALSKVRNAADATSLKMSCFYDLAGLFRVIKELSIEHSSAHTLAGIGEYLADDWGNLNAGEYDRIKAELDSLLALRAEGAAA